MDRKRNPLLKAPRQALDAFARIRADTLIGMAFSNIIALAIIICTAATLHRAGVTSIETSTQAAEANRRKLHISAVYSWHRRYGSTCHSRACRLGCLRSKRGMEMAGWTFKTTSTGQRLLFGFRCRHFAWRWDYD